MATKGTWLDEGYGRPKGAAEQRVENLSTAYRSMGSDKLKRALMQLDALAEEGNLRTGYEDRAKRLRIRIKKRLKGK